MALSKSSISFISSLQIKKYREQHRAFVVEGHKPVLELLQSPLKLLEAYALPSWIDEHQAVLEGCTVHEITPKELERISHLKTPNQVIAIAEIPLQTFDGLAPKNTLHLFLDDIRDPGNLGTIIRTAEWFGLKQIFCSLSCVDAFNSKTVQAAMGSLFRVEVVYTPLIDLLSNNDLPVYGAFMNGESIQSTPLTMPSILVIGNEANGISPELEKQITQRISIPAAAGQQAESLNAAVATGILLNTFTALK